LSTEICPLLEPAPLASCTWVLLAKVRGIAVISSEFRAKHNIHMFPPPVWQATGICLVLCTEVEQQKESKRFRMNDMYVYI
jgi:hypothetical protein